MTTQPTWIYSGGNNIGTKCLLGNCKVEIQTPAASFQANGGVYSFPIRDLASSGKGQGSLPQGVPMKITDLALFIWTDEILPLHDFDDKTHLVEYLDADGAWNVPPSGFIEWSNTFFLIANNGLQDFCYKFRISINPSKETATPINSPAVYVGTPGRSDFRELGQCIIEVKDTKDNTTQFIKLFQLVRKPPDYYKDRLDDGSFMTVED